MTISKRRALEITRDMWLWLAEDESRTKQGFIDQNNLRFLEEHSNCSCCAYAAQVTGSTNNSDCCRGNSRTKSCPLVSLWPGGCLSSVKSTPYAEWDAHRNKCFNANLIAQAAIFELKKLDEEEARSKEEAWAKEEARSKVKPCYWRQLKKEGKVIEFRRKGSKNEGDWTVPADNCPGGLRPWKHDEVPVGAVMELPSGDRTLIFGLSIDIIYTAFGKRTLSEIMHNKHSLDGGKTWINYCGVIE